MLPTNKVKRLNTSYRNKDVRKYAWSSRRQRNIRGCVT